MYIPGISPYVFQLGPLHVRWYGLFMAISMAIGLAYVLREGPRVGLDEDFLTNWGLAAIAGGVVGARLIFVLTNPVYFLHHPVQIPMIYLGGLSIHGGLLGGLLASWWYARRRGVPLTPLMDLAVPGIAVGVMLVRIGNIFNQEILGYHAGILGGARHPAQLYESAIGVFLLIQYFRLRTRRPPAGALFWTAVLWYSVFRGLTEFVRDQNPHYIVNFVDPYLGVGGITLTQWVTPAIIALAYFARRRTLRSRDAAALIAAARTPAPPPPEGAGPGAAAGSPPPPEVTPPGAEATSAGPQGVGPGPGGPGREPAAAGDGPSS